MRNEEWGTCNQEWGTVCKCKYWNSDNLFVYFNSFFFSLTFFLILRSEVSSRQVIFGMGCSATGVCCLNIFIDYYYYYYCSSMRKSQLPPTRARARRMTATATTILKYDSLRICGTDSEGTFIFGSSRLFFSINIYMNSATIHHIPVCCRLIAHCSLLAQSQSIPYHIDFNGKSHFCRVIWLWSALKNCNLPIQFALNK